MHAGRKWKSRLGCEITELTTANLDWSSRFQRRACKGLYCHNTYHAYINIPDQFFQVYCSCQCPSLQCQVRFLSVHCEGVKWCLYSGQFASIQTQPHGILSNSSGCIFAATCVWFCEFPSSNSSSFLQIPVQVALQLHCSRPWGRNAPAPAICAVST